MFEMENMYLSSYSLEEFVPQFSPLGLSRKPEIFKSSFVGLLLVAKGFVSSLVSLFSVIRAQHGMTSFEVKTSVTAFRVLWEDRYYSQRSVDVLRKHCSRIFFYNMFHAIYGFIKQAIFKLYICMLIQRTSLLYYSVSFLLCQITKKNTKSCLKERICFQIMKKMEQIYQDLEIRMFSF